MKPEIKKRWTDALRAYSLNPDGQRHKNMYCSSLRSPWGQLAVDGVLCQLYATEHNMEWEGKDKLALHGTTHAIPEEVKKWAGMKTHDPHLPTVKDKFLFTNYDFPTLSIVAHTAQKKVGETWAKLSYADMDDLIESDL
jgi:hypothetical protein